MQRCRTDRGESHCARKRQAQSARRRGSSNALDTSHSRSTDTYKVFPLKIDYNVCSSKIWVVIAVFLATTPHDMYVAYFVNGCDEIVATPTILQMVPACSCFWTYWIHVPLVFFFDQTGIADNCLPQIDDDYHFLFFATAVKRSHANAWGVCCWRSIGKLLEGKIRHFYLYTDKPGASNQQ